MFTADQVWGLAVAADRINGGYFKEDQWNTSSNAHFRSRQANKLMVKQWLRNNDFTEATAEDIAKGQEIRNYFNGFLLKQISGKINDFESQALRIAQMDEFTGRNLLEFAVISCLPSVMVRDQSKNDLARAIRESTQLDGSVGDQVEGPFEIVNSYYSQEYNRYRITAKLVDSFVSFWYNKDLAQGALIQLKGKIKSVRNDNTTQLHYVKQVG
jgi:hypothetical protein